MSKNIRLSTLLLAGALAGCSLVAKVGYIPLEPSVNVRELNVEGGLHIDIDPAIPDSFALTPASSMRYEFSEYRRSLGGALEASFRREFAIRDGASAARFELKLRRAELQPTLTIKYFATFSENGKDAREISGETKGRTIVAGTTVWGAGRTMTKIATTLAGEAIGQMCEALHEDAVRTVTGEKHATPASGQRPFEGGVAGGASAPRTEAISSSSPATGGAPRLWSFAVGISQFREKDVSLKFADRDAALVDGHFASSSGGAVPPERRVLLTNAQATRAAVLAALMRIAKRTAPEDLLVIFLATHGVPDSGGDLYFVAHDTDPKNLVATGLPQRDLEYALGRAPAKRIVLLLDACHSGAAGLGSLGGNWRGLQLTEANRLVLGIADSRPGVAVFSAATASESSRESSRWGGGHGAFSWHAVRGLRGMADANRDGVVTIRELYDFVYRAVSGDTAGEQHPELKGTFDNALPLSQVSTNRRS